jgi:hypothetical protein
MKRLAEGSSMLARAAAMLPPQHASERANAMGLGALFLRVLATTAPSCANRVLIHWRRQRSRAQRGLIGIPLRNCADTERKRLFRASLLLPLHRASIAREPGIEGRK